MISILLWTPLHESIVKIIKFKFDSSEHVKIVNWSFFLHTNVKTGSSHVLIRTARLGHIAIADWFFIDHNNALILKLNVNSYEKSEKHWMSGTMKNITNRLGLSRNLIFVVWKDNWLQNIQNWNLFLRINNFYRIITNP